MSDLLDGPALCETDGCDHATHRGESTCILCQGETPCKPACRLCDADLDRNMRGVQ